MSGGEIFNAIDRVPFDIKRIALGTDISIFNKGWQEGNTYYADFCGIGKKYKPKSVLEIGVRYGYSGIALCTGSNLAGVKSIDYFGIDCEAYCYRSNGVARENFTRFAPWVNTKFYFWNSILQGIPDEVKDQKFDIISVDGDHTYKGAMNDISLTWPLLNTKGIMIVDDLGMQGVRQAFDEFMKKLTAQGVNFAPQYYNNERGFGLFLKL